MDAAFYLGTTLMREADNRHRRCEISEQGVSVYVSVCEGVCGCMRVCAGV